MGQYLSLHSAKEWDRVLSTMWEPSIWANVEFTPMRRDQRLLLERGIPDRVNPSTGVTERACRYIFPESLRYIDDVIRIGQGAEASVVCGFHDGSGKVFSGLLLKAPELIPHSYQRLHEEFTLTAPKGRENRSLNPSSNLSSDNLFLPPSDGPRSKKNQESLAMSKYGTEDIPSPMTETHWKYLLMYSVREGVLMYFSNTEEECFETIRKVAAYGDITDGNLAPLKFSVFPLGATATSRRLIEVTSDDLRRRFAIKSSPEEQQKNTNCMVYCMRSLMALQLAIRGYDVRRACVDDPRLGPVVGEAAAAAWEKVWKCVRA
jgi:hypothetical protein